MIQMAIIKATPLSEGRWIEGSWGVFKTARLVEIAYRYGYRNDRVVQIARRIAAAADVSLWSNSIISAEESEKLEDSADSVQQWMNDNVAPDGFYFEWDDGEFFLRRKNCEEEN